MLDKKEVCEKITELNPDLGVCGTDIETYYNRAKGSWVIVSKRETMTRFIFWTSRIYRNAWTAFSVFLSELMYPRLHDSMRIPFELWA